MAFSPALVTTVKITAKDINGNNIAKQFNAITQLVFDYRDGTVCIFDQTGQFYFSLTAITTLTYVITTGTAGVHTVVMS